MGPISGAIMFLALFGFVSVVTWTKARQKEREAMYRAELLKKLVDAAPAAQQPLMDFIRERERAERRMEIAGTKLPGLILVCVGAAMVLFMRSIPDAKEA